MNSKLYEDLKQSWIDVTIECLKRRKASYCCYILTGEKSENHQSGYTFMRIGG